MTKPRPLEFGAIPRCLIGLVVGWFLYMAMALPTLKEDGAIAWIFQPIIGLVFSGAFTVAFWLLGFFLETRWLSRTWHAAGPFIALLPLSGMAILYWSNSLGLTERFTDPATGANSESTQGWALLLSCVLIVFPIVNWPGFSINSSVEKSTP